MFVKVEASNSVVGSVVFSLPVSKLQHQFKYTCQNNQIKYNWSQIKYIVVIATWTFVVGAVRFIGMLTRRFAKNVWINVTNVNNSYNTAKFPALKFRTPVDLATQKTSRSSLVSVMPECIRESFEPLFSQIPLAAPPPSKGIESITTSCFFHRGEGSPSPPSPLHLAKTREL